MKALVLSGGGAKGAYQVGILHQLFRQGYDFDLIAGVSVGTLNGGMLAMNKWHELLGVWNELDNDKIYSGGMDTIDIGIALLQGRKSLLSNEPLFQLIQEHFRIDAIVKDFRFGVVAYEEGIYWSYRGTDFTTDRAFQDAVRASTAQPVIWPPVFDTLTNRSGWLHGLYDGGVMNVSPIADVLDENPEEIVVINCSNTQHERTPRKGTFDNIPKIAMRTLDLMLADNFRGDINTTLRLNSLVSQAESVGITLKKPDGSPYKAYHVRLIEPEVDLGDSFDFSQPAIQMRIDAGRRQVI